MPTLPCSFAPVGAAVASMLLSPSHSGSLYDADDVAMGLNVAAGVYKNTMSGVNSTLLLRAFAHGADEYVMQYDVAFGCSGDGNVLYVRRRRHGGRHGGRTLLLGRFSSMEAAKRAKVVPWHVEMGDSARSGLIKYHEDSQKASKKRPAVDVSPDEEGVANENSPPRPPLVSIQPSTTAQQVKQSPTPSVIHYVLDGRAGKMAIPANGLLLVRKMRENLEPLTYTDTEEAKYKRVRTRFTAASYGSVSVWIPARASLVGSNHLSRIECESSRSRRFYRRFSKKQCMLSPASMRVITAFSLHNSGGSDEGTVTALAAAFWVISYEMGKALTPKQLGQGTPSESLLRKWESRYAADCFICKCHKMKKNGTKYLHYSGDHGHRKGQDSLVKGWSYASWDKNGKRVIDFLCSDIDKCGHTTEEVVLGVKKAFDRIKLLVPTVMCISSEGDAGGGGSVQSTFGGFIDKGILEDFARFINCLMHALSKCLQRASEAVFGKQGMGQNSYLQNDILNCKSVQAHQGGRRH